MPISPNHNGLTHRHNNFYIVLTNQNWKNKWRKHPFHITSSTWRALCEAGLMVDDDGRDGEPGILEERDYLRMLGEVVVESVLRFVVVEV